MNLSGQPSTRYLTVHREIDVLDPESFTPCIKEIMTSLPKINRYNGQTTRPYSVALHSFMCTYAAEAFYGIKEPHLLLAMLLHDAAEAYIGDIVRPIKHVFASELHGVEQDLLDNIFDEAGLTYWEKAEIRYPSFLKMAKEIDSRMAITEIEQLRDSQEITKLSDLTSFDVTLPTNSWQRDEEIFEITYARIQVEREKLLEKSDESL